MRAQEPLSPGAALRLLVPDFREQPRTAPVRTVTDAKGNSWTLFERPVGPPPLNGMSLLAESQTTVRRVDVFPYHWDEMPDAALLQLIEAPVTALESVSAELQLRWEEGVLARVSERTRSSRPNFTASLSALLVGLVPALIRRGT